MIAIIFVPTLALEFFPQIGGVFMNKTYMVLLIILVTMVANIVRALRYCKDKPKSWGINYGWKKGLVAGIIAVVILQFIQLNPEFETPFLVLSFLPGIGSMIDGIILMTGYLAGYLMSYPIWGGSC
jgi:hypothetical protein